ncbi:hypothetical protein [Rhizobium sp. PAMB 3182]
MTLPLAENPAVLNPAATLTRSQQDALSAIAMFKRSTKAPGGVEIGGTLRCSSKTIKALQRYQLIRGNVPSLAPTLAGEMALERLQGGR